MIPYLVADAMFAGGLLLSATLIGFALWLHFNERDGWGFENNDPNSSKTDGKYLALRKRSRNRVHFLFAASGVLILIAAFAGPGIVFVAAWSCVAFALMAIMAIAVLDGIRTHVYRRYETPKIQREIQREIFDADD
ncbi:MAG: hypothetical protein WBD20_12710 [Pirellulaceae bacterium]